MPDVQAQAKAKATNDAPKPLTVAEIVAYQPPANLAGWKLTQDTAGGYSYRAVVGDVSYIATPKQWEGRIMAQTTSNNTGTNFGLNLNELPRAAEEFRTEAGTFRPEGAEGAVLNGTAVPAVPAADGCAPPSVSGSYDNFLLPAAIVGAGLLYFFRGNRK